MNSIRPILTVLAALSALVSGCSTPNPYDVMDRKAQEETIPLIAVVPDFEDAREYDRTYNSGMANIPVIGLWGGYSYDRHDQIYDDVVAPFSRMLAEDLAERLEEAGIFSQVEAVRSLDEVEEGTYDLVVEGRINKLQRSGARISYGLSIFSWIPHRLFLPNTSRKWTIEVGYQLYDGYTMEPLADEALDVELGTRHSYYTVYADHGKVKDLENDVTPVFDAFIDWVWTSMPEGGAEYWADLRQEGQEYLAQKRREQELIRKGTPPTITFISPSDDTEVRTSSVDLNWSLTAPGGLKALSLSVNDRPLDAGVSAAQMARTETAPRSIPARKTEVPLQLGENRVEALIIDHRGNETQSALTLRRLPAALQPEQRYALLISPATEENQQALSRLETALTDEMTGQFSGQDVFTYTPASLEAEGLEETMREFGGKPLAGDLAFIYLRTTGEWADLTIGETTMTFDDFLSRLEGSLATREVVLLADIDWSGGPGDEEIRFRLQNLPARWAVIVSQASGGAAPEPVLAPAATKGLKGDPGSTRRLTLQRFVDGILNELDSYGELDAEAYGRYDPSITMAERE